MRKLWCFLFLIISCLSVMGQDSDLKKKINKIKKSTSYICAEATLPTKEEAYSLANELLMSEINNWIKKENLMSEVVKFLKRDKSTKEIKQVVIEDVNSFYETCEMKRGNSVRAFVYVKKNQIIPIYGDGHVITNDDQVGNEIQSLDVLNQEQIPQIDTLIITSKDTIYLPEQPKPEVQEVNVAIKDSTQSITAKIVPAPKSAISKDTIDLAEQPKAKEQSDEKQQVIKVPVANIPIVNAPIVNAPVANIPVKQKKQVVEVESYSKVAALNSIMNAGNMTNMKPIFSNLKAKNRITYNKATNAASIDSKAYLLIYDKSGEIVAVLEPGNTIRKNLFDQKNVQLSDFKGCAAYWFILD